MKVQKNLLWIPVVLAFIWGIFGLLAPGLTLKMLKTPAEWTNPGLLSWLNIFAVSMICLGIIPLWMRTISDKKIMTGAMTIVSLVLLLFGLQGVLQTLYIKGLELNLITFVQGIVLILLAALFYIKRKPA